MMVPVTGRVVAIRHATKYSNLVKLPGLCYTRCVPGIFDKVFIGAVDLVISISGVSSTFGS